MQLDSVQSEVFDYHWVLGTRGHNKNRFFLPDVAKQSAAQATASKAEYSCIKKQVRVNTRLCYSCVKYNGIAEDLEGYSWLLLKFLGREVSLDTLDPQSGLFGAVGTFDADPNKIIDLVLGLEEETKMTAGAIEGLSSKLCFERTQLAGFYIRRSLEKARKPRFNHLARFLVDECGAIPEEIYAYLWPNEAELHVTLAGMRSAGSLTARLSLQRGISILGDVLKEHALEERSYFFIKRLSQIGFSIQQFPRLFQVSLRHLKLALSTAGSSDLIPVCNLVETIGPALVCDVSLYRHVLVYLKKSTPTSEHERSHVARILSTCMLPALSRVKPNPMLSTCVWGVLAQLSFPRRGKIYHSFMELSKQYCGPYNESSDRAVSATYRILRRLSPENVKYLGRKLGKLMIQFPLKSSEIILEQIEAYPNMIQPVVDSLKYCSNLALDVMLYRLVLRLSSSRSKLKDDGQHVSLWFSALSSFTGIFCKRYQNVELQVIIQYIMNKLKDGQSLDLLVLRELIHSMSGIEIMKDFSMDSVLRTCGGPYLQSLYSNSSSVALEYTKSTMRLRKALQSSSATMPVACSLFILIVKCEQTIIPKLCSKQLKFISQWYDECHHVLLLYVSFLRLAYTESECVHIFRSIWSLVEDYNVGVPILSQLFRRTSELVTTAQSKTFAEDSEHVSNSLLAWRNIMPGVLTNYVSPHIYITFWELELSDIFEFDESYSRALMKCESKLKSFQQLKSAKEESREDERVSHMWSSVRTLKEERIQKATEVRNVKAELKRRCQAWIKSEDRAAVALHILQHMILPRVRLSMIDAYYAAHFIDLLSELNVPSFNALFFYDRLFRDFTQLAYSCSERESSQLGVYMSCVLAKVSKWREHVHFERECLASVNFEIPAGSSGWRQANHSDFIDLSYNWHLKLTKGILARLNQDDYMELRNTIAVLVRIVDEYPIIASHGLHLQREIERLKKSERRGDIQTLATRYFAMLLSTRRRWLSEDEYRRKS